jgi:hypothetical protein
VSLISAERGCRFGLARPPSGGRFFKRFAIPLSIRYIFAPLPWRIAASSKGRWNSIVTSGHKTWEIGLESLISTAMRRPIIEVFIVSDAPYFMQ